MYFFESRSSNNYTWDSATLALVTALHAILGVPIAGILFFKPIIDGMALGAFITTGDSQGYTLGGIYGAAAKEATSVPPKLGNQLKPTWIYPAQEE